MPRLPDWKCCGSSLVFGSKQNCQKCGRQNPNWPSSGGGGGSASSSSAPSGGRGGGGGGGNKRYPDWNCSKCNFVVFGSKEFCKCGARNPARAAADNNTDNTTNNATVDLTPLSRNQQVAAAAVAALLSPSSWYCQTCQNTVSTSVCAMCGAQDPNATTTSASSAAPSAKTSTTRATGGKTERTKDWTCSNCNFVVYGSKANCGKCGQRNPYLNDDGTAKASKAVSAASSSGGQQQPTAPQGRFPDYLCPNCKVTIFGSKPACSRCGYANPGYTAQTQTLLNEQKQHSKKLVDDLTSQIEAAQKAAKNSINNNKTTATNDDADDSKTSTNQLEALLAQIKSAQEQLAIAEKAASSAPASIAIHPPSYWETSPTASFPSEGHTLKNITTAFVGESNVTYKKAIENFIVNCAKSAVTGGTSPRYTKVKNVFRLQNDRLWVFYSTNRSMMKSSAPLIPQPATILPEGAKSTAVASNDDDTFREFISSRGFDLRREVNEGIFFHGTSARVVPLICEGGFDERVSSPGCYGSGCYAAENPTKAFGYIQPDPKGIGYAFLARIAVGNYFKVENKTDSSLRRPPAGFDSVLGTPSKTSAREFVLYDRRQTYPEFLIELEQ